MLPSKTAIVPVNKELMPRSHEELERCSRTVYVANIDKKVDREDVRAFFEQLCGAQAVAHAALIIAVSTCPLHTCHSLAAVGARHWGRAELNMFVHACVQPAEHV